jgi:hypothetical protein
MASIASSLFGGNITKLLMSMTTKPESKADEDKRFVVDVEDTAGK